VEGWGGLAGSGDGSVLRVFVSHTSELREFPADGSYVAAVEQAIFACRHVIVDMADFPEADQVPAELCAGLLRECDVYVGMLGTRYGSPVRDRPEAEVRPSCAGDAAPGQILANGGHVGARFSTSQSCQALRDARDSVGVTEDLQGHLQALKVIYRQQDSLGLAVAGQGDPLVRGYRTEVSVTHPRGRLDAL